MQKSHYLPLKVIREHPRRWIGGDPPRLEPCHRAAAAIEVPLPSSRPAPCRSSGRETSDQSHQARTAELSGLSRRAWPSSNDTRWSTAARHRSLRTRRTTVAVAARKLAAYGMDARHLRVVKQAAEREVGLIEQAIAPHLRRSQSPPATGPRGHATGDARACRHHAIDDAPVGALMRERRW